MRKNTQTDAIFSDPKLAQIYDAFDSDRSDLEPYIKLLKDFGAEKVVDLGCGTGVLALLLAKQGFDVTGVDPAEASIDVAKSKPRAEEVHWIVGDASDIPEQSMDAIVMTGNVAQAIVQPEDWQSTLRSARKTLKTGGHFVFETRKPEAEAWKGWNKEQSFTSVDVPGLGQVDGWVEMLKVDLPLVSFRWTYVFHESNQTITSDSTLRYRTVEEMTNDLEENGFETKEVREAPDRPNKEFVVIAQAV